MRFADICKLTEKEAIMFFVENGLLQVPRCSSGHPMKLLSKGGDTYRWMCKPCDRLSVPVSSQGLRVDNWFEGSKTSFLTIAKFIHLWSTGSSSIKYCIEELAVSPNMVVDWNNHLRHVCAWKIDNTLNKKKIGGPGNCFLLIRIYIPCLGTVVEIDESLMAKRKNQTGRMLTEKWMFGGICRETKERFAAIVADRTAETLIQAIETYIEPGTEDLGLREEV